MPPKRRSTGSSGRATKKTKTTSAPSPAPSPTPPPAPVGKYEPPRSKRWAPVSASANAESDYRIIWKDEKRAYSYITICSAIYSLSLEEEDDDDDEDSDDGDGSDTEDEEEKEEEEDDDDGAERLGPKCGKKRCVCFKPLSSNPEHPWAISYAGYRKFGNQFLHQFVRDPDNFGMYTFNDHAGYGSLQVLQNLFLDFEEAAEEKRGEWREQWAVCEAVVHWLAHDMGILFTQTDDADGVHAATELVGRMFLAMLAQLDDLGLVGDATAVRSLGCTMALYMALAHDMREAGWLPDGEREGGSGGGRRGQFQASYFDDAVLAYANRRGVTLAGPRRIEELTAQAVDNVALPPAAAEDPWGWKAALQQYVASFGTPTIGSDDYYDITTWSSAERKKAAFDKKDPFDKETITALKKGMVLQMV